MDYSAFIYKVLSVPLKLCSTDSRLWLLQHYETTYGIFDHDNDPEPESMALVRMHSAEDPITGFGLRERMRQFEERNVYSVFGVSWSEFKELPTYECMLLLEFAEKRQKANLNMDNKVLQDFANKVK